MATELPELESRFASLEQASRSLSADVTALNRTLEVINELQSEQREQKHRQEMAELEIARGKALAEARDRRARGVFRFVLTAMLIIVPAVSALVYWSLILHVNDLLNEQKRTTYNGCLLRNQVPVLNAEREEALTKVETDPAVAKIHSDSAKALREATVDCSRYLPK